MNTNVLDVLPEFRLSSKQEMNTDAPLITRGMSSCFPQKITFLSMFVNFLHCGLKINKQQNNL